MSYIKAAVSEDWIKRRAAAGALKRIRASEAGADSLKDPLTRALKARNAQGAAANVAGRDASVPDAVYAQIVRRRDKRQALANVLADTRDAVQPLHDAQHGYVRPPPAVHVVEPPPSTSTAAASPDASAQRKRRIAGAAGIGVASALGAAGYSTYQQSKDTPDFDAWADGTTALLAKEEADGYKSAAYRAGIDHTLRAYGLRG